MKLSEAIALGSAVTKQIFGALMDTERTKACAIGAAYIALGLRLDAPFQPVYPWTYEIKHRNCPACPGDSMEALSLIMHLNDIHEWTRERIADWVATIEPEEVDSGIASSVQTESQEGTYPTALAT